MDYMLIRKSNMLNGIVNIEGSKNSSLPILVAALLSDYGITILKNIPKLSDIYFMCEIIKSLNVKISFNNNIVKIHSTFNINSIVNSKFVDKIRASILLLGVLISKNKYIKIKKPGGCSIGKRPINFHIEALKLLGAKVIYNGEYIEVFIKKIIGSKIKLKFPSVGATENLILLSVKAIGITILENVACEPEIEDLINFLNNMGAKIFWLSKSILKIIGVNKLFSIKYSIIQDRIEAGTFMIASVLTNGNILIKNANFFHNYSLILKLKEMGAKVIQEQNGIRVIGNKIIKSVNIKTGPFPEFSTDLQPIFSILQLKSNGISIIYENIFENRFRHFNELIKLNANIKINKKSVIINGGFKLKGNILKATDLRSAAALILVGLYIDDITIVYNLNYLDRGYYKFDKKLNFLGANIKRISF